MPCLLVIPHSAATQRMRSNFWSTRGSFQWLSKPSGVESDSSGSAPALFWRYVYRDPSQKIEQITAITTPMITARESMRRMAGTAGCTATAA